MTSNLIQYADKDDNHIGQLKLFENVNTAE
jgi:hypothetical protein